MERGLVAFAAFLGVDSASVAKEVAEEEPPRGGAGGRDPDSTSVTSSAALRLMMRKRPSTASYVAPERRWGE